MKRSAAEIEAIVRELAGPGANPLEPSAAQLRGLLSLDAVGPLQFLNLLAYHEIARYSPEHPCAAIGSTGAAAYARYGEVAVRHVTARGGSLVLFNHVVDQVIGAPVRWDQIAVMQYPHVDAFIDMVRDPDYRAALVHRDAGLARTEVHATRPLLAAAHAAAPANEAR
jgi:uncharacterized protein (DUF1330 family)